MSAKAKRLFNFMLPMAAICALGAATLILRVQPDEALPRKRTPSRGESFKPEGKRWIISRLDKDAYLENITGITKQITLKPNPGIEAGSVTDLSILEVAEESPIYAAGFRKGDRIMRINGTPIGTVSRAVNLVHEIKACNRLTVQVQRDGQIIEYQFDFE
jgi:membrane-associated protease RseP (regulator of RpoE activity)